MTIAPVKGDQTLALLAEAFDVAANRFTQWKAKLVQRVAEVFGTAVEKR